MKTELLRAVFFDIDDTLLDFNRCAEISARRTFAHFALPMPENTMAVFFSVNNRLWEQIERRELSAAEHRRIRWNLIFNALGISFDGPRFEEVFRQKLWESHIPVEGALPLLRSLHGRYLLCAASNAADGPQQRRRLIQAGMMPFFRHCFLSGEIGAAKPDAAFFDACFAALDGILPDQVLLVGDSPSADMAGGKAYGLHTCLLDPLGRYGDCRDADLIISSLSSLLPLF